MIDIESILRDGSKAELQRLHDELHDRGFLTANVVETETIGGRFERVRAVLRAAFERVVDAKKPRPRPPNPCKPCNPKKRSIVQASA